MGTSAALDRAVARHQEPRWRKLARPRLAASKALELAARRRPVTVTAHTFWGDPLLVTPPDRVSLTVYRYGFFEPDITRLLVDTIRPGDVFVDVGAHLGYFTRLACHLGADVHAFEPSPSTFPLLALNAPSAAVNMAAVWNEPGTVTLFELGAEFSAFNTVDPGQISRYRESDDPELRQLGARLDGKTVEVDAVTLDSYGVAPSVVKVDAEGAEPQVVEGALATLEEHRPLLIVEVGFRSREDADRSAGLIDTLAGVGYRPHRFTSRGVEAGAPVYGDPDGNLVFVA